MNTIPPAAARLIALSICVLAGCSKHLEAPEPVRAVKTMVVQAASTSGRYEYAGEIRSRVESRLSFRVGGKMIERPANLGDTVKAGQVLARLDPKDLLLGQEVAVAAVASAEVNLRQSDADFKRYKDLRDQGFISNAELERRETTLKVAQAQFSQARAQSGVQGNQATYASLVADVAGVVTAVEVEPGMVVAAGTPVLRLAHDGPRDVVFSVPEDKVPMIQALAVRKDAVRVRFWGANQPEVEARIREIAAAADAATRTFQVKADLGAGSTPTLRLGQTATVVIEGPKLAGIARVPLSSLKEEKGQTIVWVVDSGSMSTSARPVRVAAADGNEAVVTAGLVPGDRVVTAGVHVLSPGQKVRLYADPEQPLSAASATALPANTKAR